MSEINPTCPRHSNGEHCWHQDGNTGFSGKWKSVAPVKCCHCGQLAFRQYMATHYEKRGRDED